MTKTISWQAGAKADSNNTTVLDIPKPAGLQNGDWYWLLGANQNVAALTAPAGFSTLWSATQTAFAMAVFTKWITDAASEPSIDTITKTSARGVGIGTWFRNVDPTTPTDASNGQVFATGSPSFNPLTPPAPGGGLIVGIAGGYRTASNTVDFTATNGDQGIIAEAILDPVTINVIAGLIADQVYTAGSPFQFTLSVNGTFTRSGSKAFHLKPAPDDPPAASGNFFQFL